MPPENSRLEPELKHWWQAGKADMLTITPHIALTTFFKKRKKDYCMFLCLLDFLCILKYGEMQFSGNYQFECFVCILISNKQF